jgi:hypothetical protein
MSTLEDWQLLCVKDMYLLHSMSSQRASVSSHRTTLMLKMSLTYRYNCYFMTSTTTVIASTDVHTKLMVTVSACSGNGAAV